MSLLRIRHTTIAAIVAATLGAGAVGFAASAGPAPTAAATESAAAEPAHEGDMVLGPSADFEPALKRGQALLDKGDPAAALVEFKKAIQAGDSEYQGYLYAAIASYRLGDLKAAQEDGQKALFFVGQDDSPDAKKAREVVALIEKKGTFAQKRAEGDAAFGDGLMAKAAQCYADAFAADPTASDVGLKAAALLADRFSRLLDAAIIWETIVHQGGNGASTATEELGRHDKGLKDLLTTALARRADWRNRHDVNEPLRYAQAFPDNLDLQVVLAEIYAGKDDEAQTIAHLKRASQLGLEYAEFSRHGAFRRFLANPEGKMANFIRDAFGPDALAAELKQAQVWQKHQRWTVPELGLELSPIPAGTFVMGSPETEAGRYKTEGPQTTVTISRPFWLGRTEVTQGQWQQIMGNDVRSQRDKAIAAGIGSELPTPGVGAEYPIYYVSWSEAMGFCRKLTQREAAAGRLPDGYAYTLPTEAQWEYACRAGTTGPIYTGSMTIRGKNNVPELDAIAWYAGNCGVDYDDGVDPSQIGIAAERQYNFAKAGTHPVGQKRPNAWGLYDMLGNVMEWCADWHGAYPGGATTDPTGPLAGTERVLRGASLSGGAASVRCANRSKSAPEERSFNLGFRVALAPTQ
ncbi:MAG TPA: SUMF1/EgtB/PvdO family nonheme iron enzyme [Opitutaceae bacterium]|nr:SUMF1/EgtB/PvdO family nonheme iron enzyme [Opitutaceae bacterium]